MLPSDPHDLPGADPAVPGLAVLLDDAALSERLESPTRRTYVRYKPGTSAIALLDVDGRAAIGHAWGAAAAEKREKVLRRAPIGQVLLDDPPTGLVVVDAQADRRLPALRLVHDPEDLTAWLAQALEDDVAPLDGPVTLSHKPARRWVGRMEIATSEGPRSIVLRTYPRQDLERATTAYALHDPDRLSREGGPDLPRVLAVHPRGLVALEHLPGRTLDRTVDDATLRGLGRAVAQLHRRGGPGAELHGDLSLDQVVVDGGRLGIIDLDRAHHGQPGDDLASLLAVVALEVLSAGKRPGMALAEIDRVAAPLLEGYRQRRALHAGDLGDRTAEALRRRADEPFRTGHPQWPQVSDDIEVLARHLEARGAAA